MRGFDPKKLAEFIQSGTVPYKSGGRSYVFACPRCNKSEKLWMRKTDGRFICWYCAEIDGYQGKPEFALRDLYGTTLEEIRTFLYGYSGQGGAEPSVIFGFDDFYSPEDADEDLIIEQVDPLKETDWPFDSYPIDHEHAWRGREYLLRRGISLEIAMLYGLRYWPVKRRVLFPVTVGGKLYGYQARTIGETEFENEDGTITSIPKILTSDDLKRERLLMFMDRLQGVEHAVVCEGPVDAIKAHLCGGNVATMGKAVAQQQLGVLRGAGVKRVFLALDPDAAAETARLAVELGDLEVYHMQPPPGRKDLGECTFEEVRQAQENAQRITPGSLICYFKDPYSFPR